MPRQQGPRHCIEERPRQFRERFVIAAISRYRVAGREKDSVGIELELSGFRGGQEATSNEPGSVPSAWREHERRLGKPLDLAGNKPVGREVHHAYSMRPMPPPASLRSRIGMVFQNF
jgi:hypothetical protein